MTTDQSSTANSNSASPTHSDLAERREALDALRKSLAQSWTLFRQVAPRVEDSEFAYRMAVLHLKAYLIYCAVRSMAAVGIGASAAQAGTNLAVSIRGLKKSMLVKLIRLEPGPVVLVPCRPCDQT